MAEGNIKSFAQRHKEMAQAGSELRRAARRFAQADPLFSAASDEELSDTAYRYAQAVDRLKNGGGR